MAVGKGPWATDFRDDRRAGKDGFVGLDAPVKLLLDAFCLDIGLSRVVCLSELEIFPLTVSAPLENDRLVGLLRGVVRDCGKLYRQSARYMLKRHPTMIEGDVAKFVELMDDLHRGLLIKVYVTIVRADDRWTGPEKRVAAAMIEYLWDARLRGNDLREAATGLFAQADALSWESLVAPFVRYSPLADSRSHVETIVMRLANLVAKCDGQTMPEESIALHTLQKMIDAALHPATPPASLNTGGSAQQSARKVAYAKARQQADSGGHGEASPENAASREQRLATAMDELEGLIGLDAVKKRVRSYANFLRLQQNRASSGLSTMPISLHMMFTGNPGTGKTTVARIIGQILGAMGRLPSGHVVETDRSGLVAEYAGQTGPKTNALCDSARGGVLFIDEAYSLMDASGEDAYGREALQTLLKRMEDDRGEMAVIVAGYPDEMQTMVRSNPGLSSRINTTIEFEDYSPADLGRIFEAMCRANQYDLPAASRHRLLVGFDHLYRCRDRHFGNGRLARNALEDSVRHLADRVAETQTLTESLLSELRAVDIAVPGLSMADLNRLQASPHELRHRCSKCERWMRVEPDSLGGRVRCTKCEQVQSVSWASVRGREV